VQLLFLLWTVIEDHDNLFVMAESVHFLGIALLIYKLVSKRNCGGTLFMVGNSYSNHTRCCMLYVAPALSLC
jgi:hypothetical protein